MLRKLAILGVVCIATAGSAFAQSSDSGSTATDNKTGAAQAPGMLDDPVAMKPFYTDDTLMTLRTDDELRAAFKEVNEQDKAKLTEECKHVTTQRSSFCKAFNDANQM